MEIQDIKEILKKASVEVDIQGHGINIGVFEPDFERVSIEIIELIKKSKTYNPKRNCKQCGKSIPATDDFCDNDCSYLYYR